MKVSPILLAAIKEIRKQYKEKPLPECELDEYNEFTVNGTIYDVAICFEDEGYTLAIYGMKPVKDHYQTDTSKEIELHKNMSYHTLMEAPFPPKGYN